MIPGVLTVLSFLSLVLFPWPLTALLALAAAVFEPLVPLAIGVLADTLYYSSGQGIPLFALAGAVATFASYLLRKRLFTR